MNARRNVRILVVLVCALLVATALTGLLFQGEGSSKTAWTIDGREVDLFGRGAYANHSILRATTYIGADLTMIFIVVPLLLIAAIGMRKNAKGLLVCGGGLMIAFYYSISLAFGAAFNQFFLLYTALFSVAGVAFGYVVYLTGVTTWKRSDQLQSKNQGTTFFLFLAGASALIWLSMIIPAMIRGNFSEFIDLNTTEPTFVLDIGIVFPLFTFCAIMLRKRKEFGYRFTPILLTFYSLVGALVVMQTIVQQAYGIEIPLPKMIGLVVSFIILGLVALVLNVRFMRRNVKENYKN